jgi:hypothetical protein
MPCWLVVVDAFMPPRVRTASSVLALVGSKVFFSVFSCPFDSGLSGSAELVNIVFLTSV